MVTMAELSITPREPHEHHRVALTLELFDLASVIALDAAAPGCCATRAADAPPRGSAERVPEMMQFAAILLPRLTWQIEAPALS